MSSFTSTCVLTVAQREAFNEIANRDCEADSIREGFDFDKWASDETEIFHITSKQKDYLLKVWDTITPR